ncbi:retrotransposon protein [Cucumis melo var. makuwa]|uniref:Retrotransposon protein n=1 Tax=Cucumis melo var. makuwa TaxID=1194695 RepID=A0A5A7VI45_CUCMM|nr:retrotransposon protein [Cucumis melo var. makuwa]TYK27954.1 retrotransposon protein [Cucumis melo var. makuwa]
MSTSNRAPRHVWTKEEEGTLVECLIDLVSMGGWKSDNGTFRPGYLAQLVRMMAEKLLECQSHPAAKGLLNTPFPYYEELTYVFGRDRAIDRFAETFVDVGSNEPGGGYDRFDMGDGNEEFPPMYSQGIDLSDTSGARPNKRATQATAKWPAHALANDNHVRTEFFRILHEMPELMSLDMALLQRHLLSRMDDLRGFVLMSEDEREGFYRVLLRDITR